LNRVTVAIDPDGLATILIIVAPRARGGSGRSTTELFDRQGHYVHSTRGDGDGRYDTMSMAYDRNLERPNKDHFNRGQHNSDTPFGVYKINRIEGGTDKDRLGKAYGTGKIVLDAVEGEAKDNGRTGIAIHGGGSMLANPYESEQDLKGTAGCTRCQNSDVNELIQLAKGLEKNGDKVDHVFIGDAEYIDSLAHEQNKDGSYKYPDLRIVQGYDQPPKKKDEK